MTPQERPHDKSMSPSTSNSVFTSRIYKRWVGGNAIDREEQRTSICQKEHILTSLPLHRSLVPSHKPMSVKGGTMCPVSNTRSQKPFLPLLLQAHMQPVLRSRRLHLRNIFQIPPFLTEASTVWLQPTPFLPCLPPLAPALLTVCRWAFS